MSLSVEKFKFLVDRLVIYAKRPIYYKNQLDDVVEKLYNMAKACEVYTSHNPKPPTRRLTSEEEKKKRLLRIVEDSKL